MIIEVLNSSIPMKKIETEIKTFQQVNSTFQWFNR